MQSGEGFRSAPPPRVPHGGYPEVKPLDVMPADQVLIVQPGDTLILRYDRPIDADTANKIKEHVMQRLPRLSGVLVVNCAQLAAYRPCPACQGGRRETVGMVCQTCGTDYARD